MSREITFSLNFPATHPDGGQPTYFMEKIWKMLYQEDNNFYETLNFIQAIDEHFINRPCVNLEEFEPKYQIVITTGEHFQLNEYIKPVIYAETDNEDEVIQFAPLLQIKQIFTFQIKGTDYLLNGKKLSLADLTFVAKNSGMTADQFECVFSGLKEFSGQILCFSDKVKY